MFDVTSFQIQTSTLPDTAEFTDTFNFTPTQQLNIIPFETDVRIHKITIACQTYLNPRDNVISRWQTRLRLCHRDTRYLQGIRGSQINPVSGSFDQAGVLTNDVILIFSDREQIKDFGINGIIAGGMQFNSVSGFYIGTTTPAGTISPIRFSINIYSTPID